METIIVRCPACGVKNRLPVERIHQRPICGRCRTPLPVGGEVEVITETNFGRLVTDSPLPFLLDCWAPWCGPCRLIAPLLEGLAKEFVGRLRVGKLNVDENPNLARHLGITSIPTLILFKDGQAVDRIVGALGADDLRLWLQRHLR